MEEFGPRTWDPLTCPRRWRIGRYVPCRSERAEMIQPNDIHVTQKSTQAVYPKSKASAAECVPIVDWVTPALSLRTEIVGRDASDHARSAMFIEQEEVWMSPHVARIGGYKKRQVADQPNSLGMGMLLKLQGLLKYQELSEADLINPSRQLASSCNHGRRIAANQFRRPIQIRSTVVLFFQCAKEGIVLKPVRLLMTKPFVRRP